ncbi:hypothetical protein [Endozoicomonas sp.]|uniref:hypothetical protein n=1 Tax=Endozoicomonas sp. TaxID=1892382 RepID=UPI003AF52418
MKIRKLIHSFMTLNHYRNLLKEYCDEYDFDHEFIFPDFNRESLELWRQRTSPEEAVYQYALSTDIRLLRKLEPLIEQTYVVYWSTKLYEGDTNLYDQYEIFENERSAQKKYLSIIQNDKVYCAGWSPVHTSTDWN